MSLDILGSDSAYLYLAKPQGVPVFPRRRGEAGDCVLYRLLDECPRQSDAAWPEGFEGGILHRLDNWTSGLVVVARSLLSLEAGRVLFSSGGLSKTYVFVSDGKVEWNDHEVDSPLAHHPTDRRKMVWQRGKSTKHRGRWRVAQTSFQRLDGALWQARMNTGVRHQIRLHAASVGLALRGDSLYGGGGDGQFFLHHLGLMGWPQTLPDVPLPPNWPGPLLAEREFSVGSDALDEGRRQ